MFLTIEQAKAFKRWVTSEVLPKLHKLSKNKFFYVYILPCAEFVVLLHPLCEAAVCTCGQRMLRHYLHKHSNIYGYRFN